MEENKFRLNIVTPEKSFYDDTVDRVMFRSTEGDMAVLYGHINLTTTLDSGVAIIYKDDIEMHAVLHGGFAEIKKEQVTILCDAAEWPNEIDLERARLSKERAEKRLESKHDIAHTRAEASLMRALARIEALDRYSSK